MKTGVLLDSGPLVAYFCARENFHDWAVEILASLGSPIVTCEPVLTEACFLLARNGLQAARVLEPLERGRLVIGIRVEEELGAIRTLMERYANVPMSLADACLVRLTEMTGLPVCTLNSDFSIYRAHRRRALNLISPVPTGGLHEP